MLRRSFLGSVMNKGDRWYRTYFFWGFILVCVVLTATAIILDRFATTSIQEMENELDGKITIVIKGELEISIW